MVWFENKSQILYKMMRFFGFNTIEDDKIFDAQRSLFRPSFSATAEPLKAVLNLIGMLLLTVFTFSSRNEFNHECAQHKYNGPMDSQLCHFDWISYGPNQVAILAFVWQLLSVVNFVIFPDLGQLDYVPKLVMIQWTQGVLVLVFGIVSFIGFFAELNGDHQPMYMQTDQRVLFSLCIIHVFLGMDEIRVRHILWILLHFYIHIMLTAVTIAITGLNVYSGFRELGPGEFALNLFAFTILVVVITVALVLIQMLKVNFFVPGGSLMKTRHVHEPIKDEETQIVENEEAK
jgi:hypothetical protein